VAEGARDKRALARRYFDGSITNTPITLAIRDLRPGCELRFNTLRGFYYCLQSTADPTEPFVNDPRGFVQALDSSLVCTDSVAGPKRFYRIISASKP